MTKIRFWLKVCVRWNCNVLSFFLSPPCLTAWSVTVSLGSISNLTCQHLSASDLNVPSLPLSPPSLHAFSLSFSSLPLSDLFIPCPSSFRPAPYVSLFLSSLPLFVAWRQMINIIESEMQSLMATVPQRSRRHVELWEIRGDKKEKMEMERKRDIKKIQTTWPCWSHMSTAYGHFLHGLCMCTVKNTEKSVSPVCQCIVLNLAVRSKTWSYAFFWLFASNIFCLHPPLSPSFCHPPLFFSHSHLLFFFS